MGCCYKEQDIDAQTFLTLSMSTLEKKAVLAGRLWRPSWALTSLLTSRLARCSARLAL